MKNGIMYDLYFGNLVPWERGRSEDPNYMTINHKISEIKLHFKDILPPDEYKRFEELEDLYAESATIDNVSLLEYGMSMGILLMIDIYGFREKYFTEREPK